MSGFIARKLIVDEGNELFDTRGMSLLVFPSDFARVREFTRKVLEDCPAEFREGFLLEQQLSEIIKNAIRHGNRKDPAKRVKVWRDFRRRARFIVEDEGEGFKLLEEWNEFFARRQRALAEGDLSQLLELASWRGPGSESEDGGNSLFAALEYWNGGMIYNGRRNKVGVVRWFPPSVLAQELHAGADVGQGVTGEFVADDVGVA